jgi:hypothetical protein
VKAVAVTLGVALLLYAASFFSRTERAQWMSREPSSVRQATQRRPSPPPQSDSAVSQRLEQPEPVVTGSLSTAVLASTDSRARLPQKPTCCSQGHSNRPATSTLRPSRAAPALEAETPKSQATERGREPIQFSLADRGN